MFTRRTLRQISGPARPGAGRYVAVLLALLLSSSALAQGACGRARRSTLPPALSDEDFWRVSADFSEAAGTFTHSDNLVSNETQFVHVIRRLRPEGGVYVGVGPEQNFSFIARLRPVMAFIVDVRRENRDLHLLYKALFEMSDDRADFLSRLFSRERASGLGPTTSVQQLFATYSARRPSTALLEANARLVRERLLGTHRFPLLPEDLEWIDHVLRAFHSDGPAIHYGRSLPNDSPGPPYHRLMTLTDVTGQSRSYLATEEAFAFVKGLHLRNAIVPVVGDFAGSTAIRRVGDYVQQHGETVTAFYASNVEVYLSREKMAAFCLNLATLPHASRTWFIDSKRLQPLSSRLESCRPAPR